MGSKKWDYTDINKRAVKKVKKNRLQVKIGLKDIVQDTCEQTSENAHARVIF